MLVKILAKDGQRTKMFLRAACRFKQLKALEASTWRTASASGESNTALIAWIAASQPANSVRYDIFY